MSTSLFTHAAEYLRWVTGTWRPDDKLGVQRSTAATSDIQVPPASSCRFPLDESTSATVTLPDAREFGYAQYGSPTGKAIFYMHGIAGSRLEAAQWHDAAKRLGARLIAVDRPGLGWSSPQPGRRIIDIAADVQFLAKHLGVKTYGVMGASAGCPYALACGSALPASELKGVSVVCGLGSAEMGAQGMTLQNKIGFYLGYRYLPWVIRRLVATWPTARLDLSEDARMELMMRQADAVLPTLHPRDAELARDLPLRNDYIRLVLRSSAQSFKQGLTGFTDDGYLLTQPWGFDLRQFRKDLPVGLWYGTQDETVPLRHGLEIATQLADRARIRISDDTHGSVVAHHAVEAIESLVEVL